MDFQTYSDKSLKDLEDEDSVSALITIKGLLEHTKKVLSSFDVNDAITALNMLDHIKSRIYQIRDAETDTDIKDLYKKLEE